IRLAPPLHRKRAARHVAEKCLLGAGAKMLGCEIVDFRKDRPRQDPVFFPGVEEFGDGGVIAIAAVEQRDARAGVGDDHLRPQPFSGFSARRATSRRTLAPTPMLVGRRLGTFRTVYSATASRTSEAAPTPRSRANALSRR